MAFQGFGKGAVAFYEELAAHNEREWWQENKDRYESEVRAPLEHLLADLAGEFGEAKVFRPNRDTRFSKDKSPYKTAAAALVGEPHGGIATYYVQISATGLMVGGGCYHPARDQLARMREAIDDDGTGGELEALLAAVEKAGAEVGYSDKLKTAPRGYSADHPRIELLRMKGLIAFVDHRPAPWLHTRKALDRVADGWRSFAPLNAWLERHVGPSTEPPDSRRR
jgi:uncharacterized protein (TIGR02453 family)